MPPIRVALIEDAAAFAHALQSFFQLEGSGIECMGLFGSAEEALEKLPALRPEVALVDINLPGLNGVQCVERLRALCPDILCVILTMYEDGPVIFDALKAGACGYLLKRTPPQEIAAAIAQAKAGGSPMSPQIARQVVSFFHRTPPAEGLSVLTAREREVLELLAQGAMYKEIAGKLAVSLDTVRTHLRKIYEKLQVHSRTEAVLKFLGRGGG